MGLFNKTVSVSLMLVGGGNLPPQDLYDGVTSKKAIKVLEKHGLIRDIDTVVDSHGYQDVSHTYALVGEPGKLVFTGDSSVPYGGIRVEGSKELIWRARTALDALAPTLEALVPGSRARVM